MQVGDDATKVRSQLCIHLSRRIAGVDLQSSLMYGYSAAVQPASAIVQILGLLTGNFAQTVD
jgi:hypothetical protein